MEQEKWSDESFGLSSMFHVIPIANVKRYNFLSVACSSRRDPTFFSTLKQSIDDV